MIENQYKVKLTNCSGEISLQLYKNTSLKREWFGDFAKIIWLQITKDIKVSYSSISLNNKQVCTLFRDITCLYMTLKLQLNIDKDLIKCNLSSSYHNIAESILLFIRINTCHKSHEDLLVFLFNEYKITESEAIEKALKLLIGNNLILSIITNDGYQFFDKNTQPHDHIYLKKHKKLIDSTTELTELMEKLDCLKIKENSLSSLYIYEP